MKKSNNKILALSLLALGAFLMFKKKEPGEAPPPPLSNAQQQVNATNPMRQGTAPTPSAWQSWLNAAVAAYGSISALFGKNGPFYGQSKTTVFYSIPAAARNSVGWYNP